MKSQFNFSKVDGQNCFLRFSKRSGSFEFGFSMEGMEGQYFIWFAKLSPDFGEQVLGAEMVEKLQANPDKTYKTVLSI